MRFYLSVFVFIFAPLLIAETPDAPSADFEGGFALRQPVPQRFEKPHIDKLTWFFLAADGGARVFDAYSTRRMLQNSCGSGRNIPGTSTCNYEQNLPDFIANSPAGIYAFEGAVWLSELGATRFLIQHNHRRLARIVSFMDCISTTSFAVNNLTLSVGGSGDVSAALRRAQIKIR